MAQPPWSSRHRTPDRNWYADLERLVQRHEQGEISDDQFAVEKQRILRRSHYGREQPEQLQVVTAVFDGELEARQVYDALVRLQRDDLGHIVDAAVLRRDAAGRVHINEYDELSAQTGAKRGVLIGALAGLIFPPTILVGAATGAAAGALMSYLTDHGFDNRELRALGNALRPGQSAIFVVAQTRRSGELAAYLDSAKSFSTYQLPGELVTLVTTTVDEEHVNTSE